MRQIFFLAIFGLLTTSTFSAFGQTTGAEKAASLRAQLLDNETKQQELQTRLQTLNEQIKPENIESALAGVGSTKPEDLREQRRKQLEIERNGVQAQLNLLITSHTRLETSIAQADAQAYRESASPVITQAGGVAGTDNAAAPVRPPRAKKKKGRKVKRSISKRHNTLDSP